MHSESKNLNLFKLTWPIFLELFLFMLMGITDILMLSKVSDDAVSAVGAANQYLFIAILILEVIGNGAAIVVSQYIGSKQLDTASKITAVAISLNLLVGLILSITFLFFGKSLLEAVNLKGTILDFAQIYITIVGGGLFVQALINTLSSIIRTYGFTKQSMFVSLGMNVIHVLLNYMLIFGHFGFPEMGVEGAAISTIISRALALAVFFWLLYRLIEVRIQLKHYISFTKEYIQKILRIGIPSAMEQLTYHACQTVFLYYVTFMGASAMASRQYAMNISMFIYLFNLAIGIGTAIIIGRLVGGGEKEAAYIRVWKSLRWGLLVTVIVNVIVIVFRVPIVNVFTDNHDILLLTSQVLLLSIFLETGRTFNIILINSLRAAGDAQFPVYMGLISMVAMSLPLGYVLAFVFDLGLAGIWMAIAADEWTRGIIMYYRWKSRIWESKSLVGNTHASA